MQSNSPGAPAPASGTLGVGELVDGKYRLVRVIGEGGWGIVFEGENVRTMRKVAIKVLRAQANVTPDVRARFEREAQAAGRIGSEHIVEVFDLGTLPDGTSYMVMELLAGQDLATRLEAGRLDGVAAANIILQILEGLGAAHRAGILHRDLKPENLFLVPTRTGEEFVKILDFGISKFNSNIPGAVSATMTGAILGSPVYMAPEQARGLKQIDARADLYAVGTLFYECVTGRVPFEGDNFNDLMFKIVLAPRPNPLELRPDLDPGLVPILLKAIAVEPADRFQSAEEFRAGIIRWLGSLGVEPTIPGELRRGGKATPRSSLLTPNSENQSVHWSAATMSADSTGSGTPLAASANIGASRRSGKPLLLALAAAAVALLAGGGVALSLHHASSPSASSASAPPMSASPSSTAAAVATSPATASTPAAPTQPPPAIPRAPARAPATAARAESAPHGGRWVPAGKSHATGATGATGARVADEEPKAADSAAPATAPPSARPTPAAPVGTVEGREIRTGL